MYWVTANLFSLSQLIILRVPMLRKALAIPESVCLCIDLLEYMCEGLGGCFIGLVHQIYIYIYI